jgi:hypothetical protein
MKILSKILYILEEIIVYLYLTLAILALSVFVTQWINHKEFHGLTLFFGLSFCVIFVFFSRMNNKE